jgi:hypothetical protein
MGDAGVPRQDPPRRRSESRQRTALVAVRFLPHERDALAETARSRGVTLSEFIRASAMRTAGALEATQATLINADAKLSAYQPGPRSSTSVVSKFLSKANVGESSLPWPGRRSAGT